MMVVALEGLGSVVLLGALWQARRLALPAALRSTVVMLVLMLLCLHVADMAQALGVAVADDVSDVLAAGLPFVWAFLLLQSSEVWAERREQAKQEQLAFFFRDVPAGVLVVDARGVVVAQSVRCAAEHPSLTVGTRLAERAGALPPSLPAAVARCLASGAPAHCAEEAHDQHGERRFWRWAVQRWASPDDDHGVVVLLEDVSAQVEADAQEARALEQLNRAQGLAIMGQLAAGAVHDLNNLLLVLQLHLEMLQNSADPEDHEALESMTNAVTMAASITHSMLKLAPSPSAKPPARQALAPLVQETVGLLSRTLPRSQKIALRTDGAESACVVVNPDRVRQLVLNLVVNARDAMPKGGVIDVVVRVPDADHVVLEVKDQGSGMSEAVRARLFEPFFSTKGSAGTGLGLAVVKSVVEECGGSIAVESAPGAGACFAVTLPTAAGVDLSARPAVSTAP